MDRYIRKQDIVTPSPHACGTTTARTTAEENINDDETETDRHRRRDQT